MSRSKTSHRLAAAVGLVAAYALTACGKGEEVVNVDAGQPVVEKLNPAPPGTSPAERLGLRPAVAPATKGRERSALEWTAPAEWKELPTTPMRDVGFQVGGDANAECTLAAYPGTSGGLLDNVNRWRGQMSLDPIDEAAMASLPKKPILGGEGTFIELAGRYVGMDGSKDIKDAKLIVVVRTLPSATVFVKLVGPASVVGAESARFDAFCASIRMAGSPAPTPTPTPAPTPAPDAPREPPPAPSSAPVSPPAPMPAPVPVAPKAGSKGEAGSSGEARGIRWTWPAGWSLSESGSSMRAATLVVDGAPNVDISLTILSANSGGLEANLNRWQGQMGQPSLSADEIAALTRISSLGTKAVVASIDGTYTAMNGQTTKSATMLGAIIERENDVVFVKATGPASDVAKLRPAFDALIASLESTDGAK